MDVPDDIREKARELISSLCASAMHCENCIERIAKALMAERERCAKIAEDWELVERILPLADDSHNEAALTGQNEAAERIAIAIRRGTA